MQVDDVFEIIAPAQWTAPLVFNSAHSGHVVPEAFQAQAKLDECALRQSQDCFVDELFGGCIAAGAPMLRALLSRSYIDLNREPYELDPRMFFEELPGQFNTTSPRVACGLGTLPRIVAEGQEIYRGRMHLSEALKRVEAVHRPYHRALAALLNEAHHATGVVLLVDCHSMPSSAVNESRGHHERQIDVVLGDRFGAAAGGEITKTAETILRDAGLHAVRNRPYPGGFSTENHGRPHMGRHALQIEINRGLYLHERRQTKSAGFAPLQNALNRLCFGLADLLSVEAGLETRPMAAE
jgi:N-formylglutamate amidohydrolase